MKAVIILSGGLDSTTCMGIAKNQGYELYPMTFDYGQRHDKEIEQAKRVAKYYRVADRHQIVPVSFLGKVGKSALTDTEMEIPTHGDSTEIPSTYVPARNLIFLSLATAYAETIDATRIYLGISSIDYSGYPDCRPEFIQSLNETIRLATKVGAESEESIRIEAPLIHQSKAETIAWGLRLEVPYHLTTSCYQGGALACGVCDSCRFRLQGFKENGSIDPIPYQQGSELTCTD